MTKFLALAAVLAVLGLATSYLQPIDPAKYPGCPAGKYETNLNLEKIAGWWYVNRLTKGAEFQAGCDGSCWTVYFGHFRSQGVLVNLGCRKNGTSTYGYDQGSGYFTNDPNNSGILTYYSGPNSPGLNAFILYQDDFVIVGLFCFIDANGNVVRGVYAHTKSAKVSPALDAKIDQILIQNEILPNSTVKIVNGPECPYIRTCPTA